MIRLIGIDSFLYKVRSRLAQGDVEITGVSMPAMFEETFDAVMDDGSIMAITRKPIITAYEKIDVQCTDVSLHFVTYDPTEADLFNAVLFVDFENDDYTLAHAHLSGLAQALQDIIDMDAL